MKQLVEGQEVKFQLYADQKGLGAHLCKSADDPEADAEFDTESMAQNPSWQDDPMEPKSVISIYVKNVFIGGLIGKKGVTIKKLQGDSGAKMDIVTEEPEEEQVPGKRRMMDPEKSRLINLTGTTRALQTITRAIAKHLSTYSQSLMAKVVFLIHQSQAGRLIGKKGANIKKIRGEKNTVSVTISKDSIEINEQPLVTVTAFGPQNDMEAAIDETVNQLVGIYKLMLQSYNEEQERQLGGSGFGQGYGQSFAGYGGYDEGGFAATGGYSEYNEYSSGFGRGRSRGRGRGRGRGRRGRGRARGAYF